MICTLSKHEAESQGFDDALMLDWRGNVAESTGANIFLVINGQLHTPIPDCFLNGITRQTVIQMATNQGFNITERHIQPEEINSYDETTIKLQTSQLKNQVYGTINSLIPNFITVFTISVLIVFFNILQGIFKDL